jgi:hypothetical protein
MDECDTSKLSANLIPPTPRNQNDVAQLVPIEIISHVFDHTLPVLKEGSGA